MPAVRGWCVFAYGVAGACLLAQPLSAQSRSIDVPAESLKAALEDYIRQTGVQLLYNDAEIAGLKSSAVHGLNPPDRALDILLGGTGAVAHRDASGAVVVSLARAPKADAPPPEQRVQEDSVMPVAWESVTITGSRVIASNDASPTPIISIPTAEMNAITPSDLPDGLNKLPVFAGSRNQRTVGGSTINWPGNFLDLRDFGFNRTLILLDGRRVPYTDSNGDVDANTLPQALVSRVDIVTGGASAVYGSDAITGVVNFVIDKHFEGVKLMAQAGISGYGDDASWKAGLVAGTDFDGRRGHVEASYEHYASDGIPDMLDRPLGRLIPSELGYGTAASPYYQALNTRNVQLTPGGYIAAGALANQYFVSNGVLAPFVHGVADTGVNEIGGDGGYTGESYPGAGADAWLEASLKSDQVFGRADYDISDTLHAAVQASFSQSKNYSVPFVQQLIGGHGFAADNAYLPASASAALLAAGQSSFTLYKSFQNEPGNPAFGLTDHLDLTAMANGMIGPWRWDAYYTYGISRLHEKAPVTVNQQRLDAALDAVTDPASSQPVCRVSLTAAGQALYPNCQPFDAFGPTSESRAAWNYVTQPTDYTVINDMQDAGLSVSGALIQDWAGPVQASLSAEYRNVSLRNVSNYSPTQKVNCTGLTAVTCDPTVAVWDGVTANMPRVSEGVREGAAELDVPLFKDIDPLGTADLNAAARYTQYSVSGVATTWKLGSVWKISDALKLRATVSRDIRAPTLNNLFAPVSANQSAFSDYLTGVSNNVLVESQGNPALKPEVAKTVTAGFVLAPSFAPGLTISADWYDIGIHNVITNVSGGAASSEQICIASAGVSPYCGLVTRPFPITNTSPANFPTVVTSQSLNSGKFTTHGIDGEIDYAADLAGIGPVGQLDMRLLVSYQPSLLTTTDVPGAPTTNQAGAEGPFSVASGRVTYDLSYDLDPLVINVQERWHSSERRDANPTLVYLDPSIPQIFYTDLTVQWRLRPDGGKGGVLFLSIQNLFDQAPGLYISPARTGAEGYAYPAPFDEDVIGRYFTAGLSWNF